MKRKGSKVRILFTELFGLIFYALGILVIIFSLESFGPDIIVTPYSLMVFSIGVSLLSGSAVFLISHAKKSVRGRKALQINIESRNRALRNIAMIQNKIKAH